MRCISFSNQCRYIAYCTPEGRGRSLPVPSRPIRKTNERFWPISADFGPHEAGEFISNIMTQPRRPAGICPARNGVPVQIKKLISASALFHLPPRPRLIPPLSRCPWHARTPNADPQSWRNLPVCRYAYPRSPAGRFFRGEPFASLRWHWGQGGLEPVITCWEH